MTRDELKEFQLWMHMLPGVSVDFQGDFFIKNILLLMYIGEHRTQPSYTPENWILASHPAGMPVYGDGVTLAQAKHIIMQNIT